MQREELFQLVANTGQEHILDGYDDLTAEEKATLTNDITTGLPITRLNEIFQACAVPSASTGAGEPAAPSLDVTPPPPSSFFDVKSTEESDPKLMKQLTRLGLEAIAAGHTAALILAGGSGSRLGLDIPKGLFVCGGLREAKSLFQRHAEKVLRAQQMAANAFPEHHGKVQLLIMTSEDNNDTTKDFFASHGYFGLDAAQVHFFIQNSLPCFSSDGKLLMASKGRLCMSAAGNGGVYQALARPGAHGSGSSMLDLLRQRHVTHVQILSVDNILTKVADPLFYGFARHTLAQVAVKSTAKVSAAERVGVFARINGEWGVVEYSELGAERSAEVDPNTGDLRFNCANIASHTCTVDFLAYAAAKAAHTNAYHIARRQIKTRDGPVVGVKIELFIFDMFCHANACATAHGGAAGTSDAFRILQVSRAEEFAPIKNKVGAPDDTPDTAAALLLRLHTQWAIHCLRSAAADTVASERRQKALARLENGECQVEVSSLVSYGGEDLGPYVETLVEQLLSSPGGIVLLEDTRKRSRM